MSHFTPNSFEPHDSSSQLFVDEELRVCPGCPEDNCVLPLVRFKKHPRNPNTYSILCYRCNKRERDEAISMSNTQAVKTITTTLARAQKQGMSAGILNEVVSTVTSRIKLGPTKFDHVIGRVYRNALVRGVKKDANARDLELAVKVGSTLIDNIAQIEKMKAPAVDLSSCTEEELMQILAEPARQLILSSKEFRKQMLADDDIRNELLSEAGIETLDAEAVPVT